MNEIPEADGIDGAKLAAREAFIAHADVDPVGWSPVTTAARGHTGTFYVSSDAVKIGGVRVNTNAITAQFIADRLGASLNTSRTSDLAWEAAAGGVTGSLSRQLKPRVLGASADMASTSKMIEHSKRIDAQVQALGGAGLLRTVGKDWIIHPKMAQDPANQAINYGWHDTQAALLSWSGLHMLQTVGTRHNTKHVDYSQTLTLVRGDMLVDGETMRFEEVLRDPVLAWLISDDGSLRVTRYAIPGDPAPRGRVDKVSTPTDPLTVAAVLRDAHAGESGAPPSAERLGVAWAQIMLENGRGMAFWNHNYGNITAGSTWTGDYFELATRPPDPVPSMRFRAYPDHISGARGYWNQLLGRFASALPAFDRGDAVGAAAALKARGYFTADEPKYAAGMSRLLQEFNAVILSRL